MHLIFPNKNGTQLVYISIASVNNLGTNSKWLKHSLTAAPLQFLRPMNLSHPPTGLQFNGNRQTDCDPGDASPTLSFYTLLVTS